MSLRRLLLPCNLVSVGEPYEFATTQGFPSFHQKQNVLDRRYLDYAGIDFSCQ